MKKIVKNIIEHQNNNNIAITSTSHPPLHYNELKLPMQLSKVFKKKEISKIIYFMKKDKKNINEKINLILLNKIGKTTKPKKKFISSAEMKNFLSSFFYKNRY